METTNTLHTFLHQDIIKRTNIRSIALAVILLIAGFGVFMISPQDAGSNMDMLRICVGVGLVGAALFFITFRGTHFVYSPTSSEVLKSSVSYKPGDFFNLKSDLKKFVDVSNINLVEEKSPVRLDYLYSKDRKFVAFQLFQYSSYLDKPISEVCDLKNDEAQSLMTLLERK